MMDQTEQQKAFSDEVRGLINRFIDEYDLTYATMIGVLESHKFELLYNLYSDIEEDDGL